MKTQMINKRILIIFLIFIFHFSLFSEKEEEYEYFEEATLSLVKYNNLRVLEIYKKQNINYWIIDLEIDRENKIKLISYDTTMYGKCKNIRKNHLIKSIYLLEIDTKFKSLNPFLNYKIDNTNKIGGYYRSTFGRVDESGVRLLIDKSKSNDYNKGFIDKLFISPCILGLDFVDGCNDSTTFWKVNNGIY